VNKAAKLVSTVSMLNKMTKPPNLRSHGSRCRGTVTRNVGRRRMKTRWIAAGMAVVVCATRAFASDEPIPSHEKVLEKRVTQAEAGDLTQQFEVGLANYWSGNYPMAYHWLSIAATNGSVEAKQALGVMYEKGHFVHQDSKIALALYQAAADASYARAVRSLAVVYRDGIGVSNDLAKAFTLFRQAADLGLPEAWHDVAYMTLQGRGVQKNEEQGIELLRKAATLGDQWAMEGLGKLLFHGHLVHQNYNEARKWLQKAANRGCPEAQFLLARIMIEGLDNVKTPEQGLHWLRISAAQGFQPAVRALQAGEQSGQQQGGGYSPPAARPSNPTP
jgi:TPR repeat protein